MHRTFPMAIILALGLMNTFAEAETPVWGEVSAGAGSNVEQERVYLGSEAECGWQAGFFLDDFDDLDYHVVSFAVFDDGTGEALYVGGYFVTANGLIVNGIAKWDGAEWSALSGPLGTGMSGAVDDLAVYDDGTGEALYAGGEFNTAGGVTVNFIARWNGTEWSALSGPSGTGVNDVVRTLVVHDDGGGEALYAGGEFNTAGGVIVNNLAKWDGTAWSGLVGPSGTGTDFDVDSLTVYDDGSGAALYAGGGFATAGGVTVNRIAKWDGSQWSALTGPSDTGMNSSVFALVVYDDGGGSALYAGGGFTTAGGVPARRIAKWNGAEWLALDGPTGAGVDNDVNAFAVYDDGSGKALYAGGDFVAAGGGTVSFIAKWDGTAWSALNGPSGTGIGGNVNALAVYDDGGGEALYAGGVFNTADGDDVNCIAKWDGTAWSALSGPSGTGMSGGVSSLAVFDDGSGEALYAGGAFITAGGVTVNRIAKWDGTAWSALSGPSGTGTSGGVKTLIVYDDGTGEALFAGGDFLEAGGVTMNHIAKWDGTAWSALSGPSGTGMDGTYLTVSALAVFGDGDREALYAGGNFPTAGGVNVNRIARWDGTVWSALSGPSGFGVNEHVLALAVQRDGTGETLFAGGYFTTAGGLDVNGIAKWDGAEWSVLSGPSGTGMGVLGYYYQVGALTEFDDGAGGALYAGGHFATAGGVPSYNIAKWACDFQIFADGFETGDTIRWSWSQP